MMKKDYYAQSSGTLLDDFELSGCARALGFQFRRFDQERQEAEVAFTVCESSLNAAGTLQGGFAAAMLDETMGMLVFLCTEGRGRAVTLNLSVSYLAPGYPGSVTAKGSILKLGRKSLFTTATLIREDGVIIAKAEQVGALVDYPSVTA